MNIPSLVLLLVAIFTLVALVAHTLEYLKNEPNKQWWETALNIGLIVAMAVFIPHFVRSGDDNRPLWSYIVTTLLLAFYGWGYAYRFFKADELRADRQWREAIKAEKKAARERYEAREAAEKADRATRRY